MNNTSIKEKLASYLTLLHRYRGEPVGAYDEVSAIYDDFVRVWDHQVAAPALSHINHLIEERIKPGAVVLDAGAGTGERTLAFLTHLLPKEERPFHHCEYSSLTRFAGGLTTVAKVGKCCTVTDEFVSCRLHESEAVQTGV